MKLYPQQKKGNRVGLTVREDVTLCRNRHGVIIQTRSRAEAFRFVVTLVCMGRVSGRFAVVPITEEQKHCTDQYKSCQDFYFVHNTTSGRFGGMDGV